MSSTFLPNYSADWQKIGVNYSPTFGDQAVMRKEGDYAEIEQIAGTLRTNKIAFTSRRLWPSPRWEIESTLQGLPEQEFTDADILRTETWSKDFGIVQVDWKEHPQLTAIERRLDAVIGAYIEKDVAEKLADASVSPTTDFTVDLQIAGATEDEQAFLDTLIKDVARGLKVYEYFPLVLTKSLTLPETTNYAESDANAGKLWTRAGLLTLEPNIPNYIQFVMPDGYYKRLPVRVTQLSDGKKQFDLSYEWTADFARSIYTVVT